MQNLPRRCKSDHITRQIYTIQTFDDPICSQEVRDGIKSTVIVYELDNELFWIVSLVGPQYSFRSFNFGE